MLNKATTTDNQPDYLSPPQIKLKTEQSYLDSSPELLKLPSKSAGARNAEFFFKKNKRGGSKKRKIIQISGKIEREAI